MENLIERFRGKYHVSPDAVMNIVSGDAYLIFSRIISHPKIAFFQGEISISQRTLNKLTGLNERTVKKALCELNELNLLTFNCKFKGNTTFIINWGEVYKLSVFCSSVSYFGLAELRELCTNNKQYLPFSSIDQSTINALLEKYKYEPKADKTTQNTAVDSNLHKIQQLNTADNQTAVFYAKTAQNTAVEEKTLPKIQQFEENNNESAVFCAEMVKNTAVSDENIPKIQQLIKNEVESAVFYAKNAQNTAVVCNSASHFIEKTGDNYVLRVLLSNSESIILDEHEVSVELVKNPTAVFQVKTAQNTAVEEKTAVFSSQTAVQRTNSKYNKYNNKYNNNKYNKKEIIKENFDVLSRKNQSSSSGDSANLIFFEEPSSFSKIDNSQSNIQQNDESNSQKIFEIEIETSHFDNNVDNFLKLRKSEKYLSYEKFELDDILSNPTEHQLPEEKLIQEVWKELENEKEYFENEDSGTSQNQFTVDALGFIKNYLLRVYFDLKENTEDLQLTIQEAYSIFGFDVTTGEDGEALFIIQPDKIKNIAAKVSANKKHKMTSKETRELNIAYMDELIEIGTKHPDKFTEVFSAMDEAMFDFYEQTKELSQIHKIKLNEIVDRAIDQLGIEREDFIKALNLKEDSHKTYSLRYDFASAERVIEWNKAHNQESQVEREVNKPSQKRF